jgi:hypothetical protein
MAGEAAETEVVDVHLDALIRLNEAPYADPEDAINIVRHLKVLVTKRKTGRKTIVRAASKAIPKVVQ